MSRLVLGVDGGNTKSHYALFDEDGTLKNFVARGTLCHESLSGGYAAMAEELARALDQLLSPLGVRPSDLSQATLGLAGTDTSDHVREISGLVHDLGLGPFRLVNDAFLGIKAGTTRGVGICSVNGTGTVTAAVGSDGTAVQVGGQGYFTGDEGGGGWLAERVVRLIYDARYRCGPATKLTEMVQEALGLRDVRLLVEAYARREVPVLTLAKAAFAAAALGDVPARGLLEAMGRNAAESALGAYHQVSFNPDRPVEFVLSGSLFVKAFPPILVETFEQAVRAALGDRVRFLVLKEPPVAGAVLWALEDLVGAPPSTLVRSRVLAGCLDTAAVVTR